MAEALSQLVSADRKHIVIGFEQVPQAEGQKAGPISLNLTKVKLSEVVRLLCQADARYEYQMVESPVAEPSLRGSMIEVHPKGALENQSDLLNTRVRDYKVDADITANSAIEHIQEDATELREALYRKAEEWRKETGRQAGGVPGSLISGNMVPPRFTLQLHDVTVRQILDAISMKSIQMSKQGPDFDSSGRGVKWAPTGWQYDFVIAPDAPTGLGGNPKWEPF